MLNRLGFLYELYCFGGDTVSLFFPFFAKLIFTYSSGLSCYLLQKDFTGPSSQTKVFFLIFAKHFILGRKTSVTLAYESMPCDNSHSIKNCQTKQS